MLCADAGAWIAIGVLVLTLVSAGFVGTSWTRASLARNDELAKTVDDRLAAIQQLADADATAAQARGEELAPVKWGPRHATYVGHYNGKTYAILPPGPLSMLTIGQSDMHPGYTEVSVDPWPDATSAQLEHPRTAREGRFDFSFIVIYLLPLLILALCHASLAAERERGTLRVLILQGAGLRSLLIGKLVVRCTPVVFVFVLVAALWLWHGMGVHPVPGSAMYFILWIAIVLAYVSFWVALAAVVDARGYSAPTNAMILLVAWLLLVVVVPSLLSVVARSLYPIPTRADLVAAANDIKEEVWSGGRDSALASFYASRPEIPISRDAPGSLERFMIHQMLNVDERRARMAPLLREHERRRERHHEFVGWVRLLSPALIVQRALADVAGTGEARLAEYDQQLAAYRQQWHDYFAERVFTREPVNDLTQIPRFHYREVSIQRVARDAALEIVVLLALVLLLALWGARAYRAYPVVGPAAET